MTDKRSTMPSDFTGLDTGSAKGKNRSRHLSATALGTGHVGKSGTHRPCRLYQVTPRERHPACNACPGACFAFFLWVRVGFNSDLLGSTRSSKEPEKKEKSLKSKQLPQEIGGMWGLMGVDASQPCVSQWGDLTFLILDAFHPFVPRLKEAFMKQMQCLHASFAPFCSPVISPCSFSFASATVPGLPGMNKEMSYRKCVPGFLDQPRGLHWAAVDGWCSLV